MTTPPDRDDASGPTKGPVSTAERMRRYRALKKAGGRVVMIELPAEIVTQLVEWEWLSAEDTKDTRRLAEEIRDLLGCKVRGTFRAGPTLTGTQT